MQSTSSARSVLFLLSIFLSLTLTFPEEPKASIDSHIVSAKRAKSKARPKKVQDSSPTLTDSERSSLRYKLENAWNEVDLLVKNAETDRRDVQKQERELRDLQVLQKIPVASGDSAKFTSMIESIRKSAARFGLTLVASKNLGTSNPDQPVPPQLDADVPGFKLSEDQLVQKTRMDLTFKGTKRQLQDWMDSWNRVADPSDAAPGQARPSTPMLEWDPAALTSLPEPVSDQQWKVHVQADFFRDIRFPKLRPRDPMTLLPDWARTNLARFKEQEPLLWSLVERTRATIPKALPGYETRERFLLNSARMSFFTSKVTHFE